MKDMVNADPAKERARDTWHGKEISFKRNRGGHRFTDEEYGKLLNGETIPIYGMT